MWAKRQQYNQVARQQGFTLVELLIVIVVIAILAAITIVAYNGVQQRARDSRRQSDVSTIRKALELYKTDKGNYPNASSTQPVFGGWEVSTDTAGSFMEYLLPYISSVPVDPINDTTNSPRRSYWYYHYGAGTFGCDPTKGAFYVLRANFESAANAPASQNPACTMPYWGESYIFVNFEN
jgi:general secretion pathway protein G